MPSESPINSGEIPSIVWQATFVNDESAMSQSPINSGEIQSSFIRESYWILPVLSSQSPINSGEIQSKETVLWERSRVLVSIPY